MHPRFRNLFGNAIEKLILSDGEDEDAAIAVISFAESIPSSRVIRTKKYKSQSKTRITAQTPELGNISIENDKTDYQMVSEGIFKERVGKYLIWKIDGEEFKYIYIQPFQETIKTLGTYVMICDSTQPKLLSFCRELQEDLISVNIFRKTITVFTLYLGLISGDSKLAGKYKAHGYRIFELR